MSTTDEEPQIGERTRLAELMQIMGRHGLNGLASRLGLLPGRSEQPADVGTPERVVALHAAQLRTEGLVHRQDEPFTRLGRDDENALFDSDDFELLHARHASRSLRRHRIAAPRPC